MMTMMMIMMLMDSPYHVHDYIYFNKRLKMGCCSYDTASIKAIIYYEFQDATLEAAYETYGSKWSKIATILDDAVTHKE